MKTFAQIAAEIAPQITEMMPWDVEEYLKSHPETLIIDIRETHAYDPMHVPNLTNLPRCLLEHACGLDLEVLERACVTAGERPVGRARRTGRCTRR